MTKFKIGDLVKFIGEDEALIVSQLVPYGEYWAGNIRYIYILHKPGDPSFIAHALGIDLEICLKE